MPSAILDQLSTYGPDHCPQLDFAQASAYTQELARTHYENFSVVSWFLPRRLRDDFRHVYAFCRWADDLGDETGDREQSLKLLQWWRDELDGCYAGHPRHPVFVALQRTIQKRDIPKKPFADLIDAFVQDQRVVRYQTWDQVLDYCTRSADPVGRLVLYLCGHRDEQRQRLSDATCTALQLANFWQDVRRDAVERDRVYVPEEVARKHGLDIEQMVKIIKLDAAAEKEQGNAACSACTLPAAGPHAILGAYKATVRELTERTWPLFATGRGLWPLLEPDVRVDIQLFTLGGESILKMIRRQDYDTLRRRPSLSKGAKVALMMRAVTGKLWAGLTSGARDETPRAGGEIAGHG